MKIGAAYIRVSTDDQVEYSPSAQLREIKKRAAADDVLLPPEYIFMDEGISGRSTKKRDDFNRMIGVAKSKPKPFEQIYVWKFSRFARNQEESIVYKSLLRNKLGIDIISISEPLIDGPFGSLIERIIEWMDEYYSIRLSGEVSRGMTEKALRGEVQTSVPFGFRKSGHEWVLQPEEAAIVRRMFEAYAQGSTLETIAVNANRLGARTKHGNPFHAGRVKYLLKNRAYTGTLIWKHIEHQDKLPRIISDELFDLVADKLERSGSSRTKYAKSAGSMRHYLSGLLKCADCGMSMAFHTASQGFQCGGYRQKKCFSHFVKADRLEKILFSTLRSIVRGGEYARNEKGLSGSPLPDETELNQAELERCHLMLEKAKEAYLAGIDTLEEYSLSKAKLTAQREELTAKLKASAENGEESQPEITQRNGSITGLVALLKNEKIDLATKHDALCGCIQKIEYKKPEETVTLFFYI